MSRSKRVPKKSISKFASGPGALSTYSLVMEAIQEGFGKIKCNLCSELVVLDEKAMSKHLIDVHRINSNRAIRDIRVFTSRCGVDDFESSLDSIVHDTFAEAASSLNNCGVEEQVRYLLKQDVSPESIAEAIGAEFASNMNGEQTTTEFVKYLSKLMDDNNVD